MPSRVTTTRRSVVTCDPNGPRPSSWMASGLCGHLSRSPQASPRASMTRTRRPRSAQQEVPGPFNRAGRFLSTWRSALPRPALHRQGRIGSIRQRAAVLHPEVRSGVLRNGNPRLEQYAESVVRKDNAKHQVRGCCHHGRERKPDPMTTNDRRCQSLLPQRHRSINAGHHRRSSRRRADHGISKCRPEATKEPDWWPARRRWLT